MAIAQLLAAAQVCPTATANRGTTAVDPSQLCFADSAGVGYAAAGDPKRVRVLARLVLVGEAVTPEYGESLRALAEALAPGALAFESGLSDAELGDRYRAAGAFLCLSEREGFCLPLVEALRFGVPAVARATGAVPDTVGDAALLRRGDVRVAAYLSDDAAAKLGAAMDAIR